MVIFIFPSLSPNLRWEAFQILAPAWSRWMRLLKMEILKKKKDGDADSNSNLKNGDSLISFRCIESESLE